MTVCPNDVKHTAEPLALAALETAPSCARLHAVARLAEWNLRDLAEVAELVISELVTNAVVVSREYKWHGVPHVVFRVSVHGRCVLVEVWDVDSHPPVLRSDVPALEENGRGLVLVDALCERWGWEPAGNGGKVVWAEITG